MNDQEAVAPCIEIPRIAADWDLWAYMPETTLKAAVLLSVGFEPDQDAMDGAYLTHPGKEYERRLRIAKAHAEAARRTKSNFFETLPQIEMTKVPLPVFGGWAEDMGWLLPERFPRPVKVSAQEQLANHADLVARIEELENQLKAEKLSPRSKNSLHRIIGAMLELLMTPKYGKANDAAVIQAIIEAHGEKDGISERNLQAVFPEAKRILNSD